MDYKNISLIGFMASGKTTVGRILAEKKKMLFIDTDRVIELKKGETVSEIFKKFGEDAFRELEKEVISKLYGNCDCVFACGGGIVEREENIKTVRENSLVIYLKVSPGQAVERIKDKNQRPLLDVEDPGLKAEKLLRRREPLYKAMSDMVIETDFLGPEEAAEKILEMI